MTTFRVGQRIKKVRGEYGVGVTGIVSADPVDLLNWADGCDITVAIDSSSACHFGRVARAGEVVATMASNWEPITPEGAQPSIYSFKELMDECREGVAV